MRMWHPVALSVKKSEAGDGSPNCGLLENSADGILYL